MEPKLVIYPSFLSHQWFLSSPLVTGFLYQLKFSIKLKCSISHQDPLSIPSRLLKSPIILDFRYPDLTVILNLGGDLVTIVDYSLMWWSLDTVHKIHIYHGF